MPSIRSGRWFLAVCLALATAPAAQASFHLMQVEQLIGGICGDVRAQAIQLRMRSAGQELVAGKKLFVRDAAGNNPILLITIPTDVPNDAVGARILFASAAAAALLPNADFTLTATIPASYLAAGRLTWEDATGTVYWSLAWGGAGYTGSNAGSTLNDADGNYGPPFANRLPSSTSQSILFSGAAAALSTSNAADYALTPSFATFTNNAATAAALPDCIFGDGFESGGTGLWSVVVPITEP
jgi:hypothetical protein